MRFNQDPLYSIFEKHLSKSLMNDECCADTLIDQVVKNYVEMMTKLGHACGRIQDYIERDVREEVTDMLRKRIYGHFSLSEYRDKIKKANA
ncbi:MAG: hypothetical protein SGJ18_16370 [Pseudomonadota bacterium]|nr:hypothetical protein [Pseudomonadota bacterium]